MFIFDSVDGQLEFHDELGLDFATREQAQAVAARAIRELFLPRVTDLGSATETLSLTMKNDTGQALYKVSVTYTVECED